jgi:hypothetical protein
MNKILKLASLAAFVSGVGLFGNGCILSDCEDEDGNKIDNCIQAETPTKYVKDPVTTSLTYSAGYDLVVDSVNGKVDVKRHSGADVKVTFAAFTLGGKSEQDAAKAKEELNNDLILETDDTGRIFVRTDRDGGSSGLGADITILLPAAFDGHVSIDQNNGFVDVDLGGTVPRSVTIHNSGAGDIDVIGARGKLDLVGKFDIDVAVAEWATDNGKVITTGGTGDIVIAVPAGANGSIQATASDDGEVIVSSPPADWEIAEAAVNSKTVSFGDFSGAVVQVQTDPTGLGSVTIKPAG